MALGAELPHRHLGAVRIAEQVGLDHPLPGLRRDRFQLAECADAGIVEPDINPAETLDLGAAERLDLRLVGHVGRHGERGTARRLALSPSILQHAGTPRRQHDGIALSSERGGAADAAGGAGDDDHAGVAVVSHRRSS